MRKRIKKEETYAQKIERLRVTYESEWDEKRCDDEDDSEQLRNSDY